MAHRTLVGGTTYEIRGGRTLVGGTGYDIANGRTLVGGTGYDIAFGVPLGDFAEGEIVRITEGGSPTEFYIAKHDYEPTLNGTGRTLLVRKDIYNVRRWHSAATNEFSSCEITQWLNSDYKSLLSATAQNALGETAFPYTNASHDLTTLARSVFLLSVTELGKTHSYANVEGTELPIASSLQKAYFDGTTTGQWTRTVENRSGGDVYALSRTGGAGLHAPTTPSTYGSRPCFTLPSDMAFDEETMSLIE